MTTGNASAVRRLMFMVKWKNFCACENTWEPKAHLPSELIEAFENPEPDPVRVEEARERIGLVFERGMKVPLQHLESIEIRHDVARFLFPILLAQLQLAPTDISDQDLKEAGLPLVRGADNQRPMETSAGSCS